MFYLTYVSNATRALTGPELEDILKASRESNVQIEVTGLLLYKEGRFMQLLEGPERTVRVLLDRIVRDPRHYGVLTLQEGSNEARLFPDWSMGFRALGKDTINEAPGYSDFENSALDEADFGGSPARCLRLLQLFREHV